MSIVKTCKIGGLLCLVSIAVLVVSVVMVVRGNNEMRNFAQKRFDSILLAQEVRATSSGLTANARAFVSTGSAAYETAYWNLVKIRAGEMPRPADAAVAPGQTIPMNTLLVQAGFTAEELQLLQESVQISSDLVLLEEKAMNAVAGLFQDASGNYTVHAAPDPELGRSLMFGPEYDAVVERIMVPSFAFDAMVNKRINAQNEEVKASLQRVLLALCVSVGVIALVFFAGLWLLVGRIVQPVHTCALYAQQVADGDLEAICPEARSGAKNEINMLIDSMRRMVAALKERIAQAEHESREAEAQRRKAAEAMEASLQARTVAEEKQEALIAVAGEVEKVVACLSTATDELSAQVEQSSKSAQQQLHRVSEQVAAIEEMSAGIASVARNAALASDSSGASRTRARDGADIVSQSSGALTQVRSDTHKLNELMVLLGKQAQAIGSVITVINDIADQTNLLALNAAIEAARAGEAGRGFAVVADEVRKLAEKTMTATREVDETVSGIQCGINQSVQAMEAALGNVAKASELAEASGAALSGIVSSADQTAGQLQDITRSAEEQSSTCSMMTAALDEINTIADETAKAMAQSQHAVMDLAGQTHQLQSLVRRLRDQGSEQGIGK